MELLGEALLALIPPALVGVIFWVMMRGILRADSKERQVYAEIEAEMREEQARRKGKAVAKPATGVAKPRTSRTAQKAVKPAKKTQN